MINADKYKKNKFRKLVPTSTSENDKLQQLTSIDHEKQPSRPQLIISQDIKRSTSKVGVEGVSERYKEKHFVFERRLKTISSMNEREEEPIKYSISSVGQYKMEKQKLQLKQSSKLQSLMKIIEEFKIKAEEISKAQCLEQLKPSNLQNRGEQQIYTKIDELSQRTKKASAKLFFIYLQRLIKAIKRQILLQIFQFQVQLRPYQDVLIQEIEPKHMKQLNNDEPHPQKNNCRRNLINVSKFFGST